MLASRLIQREQGDVGLALGERASLLARLQQRGAGIDLDLHVDVGGDRIAGSLEEHVLIQGERLTDFVAHFEALPPP